MSFQIHALPAATFRSLFKLDEAALVRALARKLVVDSKPGFPCRVSLADAEVGETVMLVNYLHQPGESPYQASHAIIVRKDVEQAIPAIGTIPEMLTSRLISIRSYDDFHNLVTAEVIDGSCLAETIPTLLEQSEITYLHLHNAKQGCYLAQVTGVSA